MTSVIIVADLTTPSPTLDRAMSLYSVMKSSRRAEAFFYSPTGHPSLPTVRSIHLTKNAIFVLFKEMKEYHKIDKSNFVVYVATDSRIDAWLSFMLPRVDRVIAPDFMTAFELSVAIRQMDLDTPVHRIPPIPVHDGARRQASGDMVIGISGGGPTMYPLLRMSDLSVITDSQGPVSHGWEVRDFSVEEVDVYLHLSGDPLRVRRAMACGVIPVTRDESPFSEWIVSGVNGFLVNTESDLVGVIDKFRDRSQIEIYREILSITSANSITEEAWAEAFIRCATGFGGENLNRDRPPVESPQDRRWIVPKVILEGGRQVYIPRKYNKSAFRMVAMSDLEEILVYFASQRFREVYVFDWDYGDVEPMRRGRIENVMRALGRRALNIFWVTDRPVPKEWLPVFSKMTMLSVKDGLNRVHGEIEQN